MEIKNKNIFLNLNDGEEIIYVPEKDKANFYWNFILIIIVWLPAFTYFSIISLLNPDIFVSNWGRFILLAILIFFYYCAYKIIIDYFFTEVILTNQRFIISRFNKIISLYNNQINQIIGTNHHRRGLMSTTIKTNSKKKYKFLFVNKNAIKTKFKEVYPDYNEFKAVIKEQKKRQ